MSNDLGYKIIKAQPAPPKLIEAAKAEISMDNLRKFQQSGSSLGFERLGWGENNSKLLHDGLDVSASFPCKSYDETDQIAW
jgi:hypothetical protein